MFFLKYLSLALFVISVESFSINDTDTLSQDLLKNYNRYTRGTANQSESTELYIIFYVISINEFNEVSGKFSAVGYFGIYWTDIRMKWDPSQYNGLSSIAFGQTQVWTPVLSLANGNGNEGLDILGKDWMLVRYQPDGRAEWSPGNLYETSCRPNIQNYPYDTQICYIQIVPWGYLKQEIKFIIPKNECETMFYDQNGSWDLKRTLISVAEENLPFPILYISFELKRRADFYLINLILPIGAMGALNMFVFLLPPDSGERVGYSITLLLAICVFLTIAADNLPKSSYPSLSILCGKLLIDMLISSLVVILTIVGLRFYHKGREENVPSCFAILTKCILCRCYRRNREKKQQLNKKQKEVKYSSDYTIASENIHSREHEERFKYVERTSDDDKPVTWKEVGVASDIVFFVFTLVAFGLSHTTFYILLSVSDETV